MDETGNSFERCPVCDGLFSTAILNEHVETHFVTSEKEPVVKLEFQGDVLRLVVEGSAQERTPRDIGRGYLPTQLSDLVQLQIADPQFRPNHDSLALLESVYLNTYITSNASSLLYLSGIPLMLRDTFAKNCYPGPVQHFCAAPEDKGWGCGYRNCQMLASHLLLRGSPYSEALFGGVGYIPDVPSLQAWLECAWDNGFDRLGKYSLEGSVQGSRKWVGAKDIGTILRQFGVDFQTVDFIGTNSTHHPNSKGGTIHEGIECNICKFLIVGVRYTSVSMEFFDLCEHCIQQESAAAFAPFTQHGRQETHFDYKCNACGMSPIVGVKYQQKQNWRISLCQNCFRNLDPLRQTLYRHYLRSKKEQDNKCDHEKLMCYVWEYFEESSVSSSDRTSQNGDNDTVWQGRRVIRTNKAPLYFQHEGHSRTIVGIERHVTTGRNPSLTYSLIILDPSTTTATLQNCLQ